MASRRGDWPGTTAEPERQLAAPKSAGRTRERRNHRTIDRRAPTSDVQPSRSLPCFHSSAIRATPVPRMGAGGSNRCVPPRHSRIPSCSTGDARPGTRINQTHPPEWDFSFLLSTFRFQKVHFDRPARLARRPRPGCTDATCKVTRSDEVFKTAGDCSITIPETVRSRRRWSLQFIGQLIQAIQINAGAGPEIVGSDHHRVRWCLCTPREPLA
jgi:hypothetical protein